MNAAVAQVRQDARPTADLADLGSGSVRLTLRWWSLAADIVVALGSYELALVVFSWIHDSQVRLFTQRFDWGLPLAVAAIVITFVWLGLYKLEAYVSRPLHLATLFKGTLIALVVTAFFTFTFKSPIVSDSRLTVFTFFAAFFIVAAVTRILVIDRLYVADAQHARGRHGRDRHFGGQFGDRQPVPRSAWFRPGGSPGADRQAPERV